MTLKGNVMGRTIGKCYVLHLREMLWGAVKGNVMGRTIGKCYGGHLREMLRGAVKGNLCSGRTLKKNVMGKQVRGML